MNIVTGWSALRVLRALRTRSYRGNEVWLPVAELPARRAVEDFAAESGDGSQGFLQDADRPSTLADAGFDIDDVVAGKKVDFERFYDLGIFTVDEPLELGVFDPNKRVSLKTTKSRMLSPSLPESALLRVDSNLYIASPELIVAHIAETATLVRLIQIIMELCGSYSLPAHMRATGASTAGTGAREAGTEGSGAAVTAVAEARAADSADVEHPQATMYGIPPVSSIERIATFISQIRMRKRARSLINEALRYACEGAASPAETNLALLLGLPTELGGFGFGMPMLNARLPVPEGERDYVGQEYYDLDLYWADSRADLEYESTAFHLDPLHGIPSSRLTSDKVEAWREAVIARGAHDRTRLRDIQTLGVQVIPVVEDDLRDTRTLDHVARALLCRRAAMTENFDESSQLAALADHEARIVRESLWSELSA